MGNSIPAEYRGDRTQNRIPQGAGQKRRDTAESRTRRKRGGKDPAEYRREQNTKKTRRKRDVFSYSKGTDLFWKIK